MGVNKVVIRGTDISTSAIGFGCASLGSRVSAKEGTRALENAFDAGVRWFDVAPAYGGGEAEAILGAFAKGKRGEIGICTKFGLAAPKAKSALRSIQRLLRPAHMITEPLRKTYRSMRSTRNQPLEMTAEKLLASIDRSLAALRTEHVELFALHAPPVAAVKCSEVQEALRFVLASGRARYVGVSGDFEAARAALAFPDLYTIIQVADSPWNSSIAPLRAQAQREIGLVTHSVFGVGGALESFIGVLRRDPASLQRLHALGYAGDAGTVAADALFDRALAANADGVVLASMFSERHRESNLRRASRPISSEIIAMVDAVIAAHPVV